tara:strand:+ start:4451 stop:4795 length:345 start_codon:yes stop_codon:yes gene_type:complete
MNKQKITVSKIINIIYSFVEKNPNNFKEEDVDFLTQIEAEILDIRNLLLFAKKEADDLLLNKINDGLNDMKQLLRIIEELDNSYICRPVNGLVVHRDRLKFQKILDIMKNKYKK